jgi:hypothetical protein
MAYDKAKIFNQAKEVVIKNKLFFIEDIVAFLPISKPTFYDYFPIDSNEINELKGLLETNRVELKVSMRSKWYKSNSPALQMGLMKLLSSDEELRKLSMNTQAMEGQVSVVWNETKTYGADDKTNKGS